MANKFDLQTWTCSGLASQGTTHIGDSIATGKTRFITFLEISRPAVATVAGGYATGARIVFGSVATAAATATEVSTGLKYAANLPGVVSAGGSCNLKITDEVMRFRAPRNPSMHPLFAVTGAGNFVGVVNRSGAAAHVDSAAVVNIFAQYYDE